MKIISIVWKVIVNLVAITVTFAMFHIANSPFETCVIGALVLIYVSVVSSFTLFVRVLVEKANLDSARFIEIAKALHVNTEINEEALKESREDVRNAQVAIWINAGCNWFIGLIAILNLISAVAR